MKIQPRPAGITPRTLALLQQNLRKVLGCDTLFLDEPPTRTGSAQLRIGDEIVGTVDQVDDEGERSWAVTLVVLEEDLSAAAETPA